MDPLFYTPKKKDEGVQGLSLFDAPKISLPELVARVSVDPPSVPVVSSERGAAKAKRKMNTQNARIIAELGKAGCLPGSGRYLSRDELMARAKITVNAACGRLAPSGALLMPKGANEGPWAIRAVEDAARSFDGGLVLGYQLTDYGYGLVVEAGIVLIAAAKNDEAAA